MSHQTAPINTTVGSVVLFHHETSYQIYELET
jgi:hypothetical protein